MAEPPRILVVCVRTSGPDARRHSIVELGAAWLDGSDDDDCFEGSCSLREGAEWDRSAVELTGLNPATYEGESPMMETESELIGSFFSWAKISKDTPVIVAGSRVGLVRKFLRTGADSYDRRSRGLSRYLMDFHSVYVARCLALGEMIPSSGFFISRIFEGLDLPASSPRIHAVVSARRERAALQKMIAARKP